MNRLLRATLLSAAAAVLVYAVVVLAFDAQSILETLQTHSIWPIFAALGLSSINYLIRFLKWEWMLTWVGLRGEGPDALKDFSLRDSLRIYLAGLSMSITPGKVGEVLRSWLLQHAAGVPFARTAPAVAADRLSDLLALVLLACVGIVGFPQFWPHMLVTVGAVVAAIFVLGSPTRSRAVLDLFVPLPLVGTLARKAEAMVESSAAMLAPRRMIALTALSVVGWGLECVGYYLVLNGFLGVEADLLLCTTLWASTTIVGAISFLPGGLGATEGSLAILVTRLAVGVTQPIALASTLVARGCTLWWGELIGGVALLLCLRDPRLKSAADRSVSLEIDGGDATSTTGAPPSTGL